MSVEVPFNTYLDGDVIDKVVYPRVLIEHTDTMISDRGYDDESYEAGLALLQAFRNGGIQGVLGLPELDSGLRELLVYGSPEIPESMPVVGQSSILF